MQRWRWSYVASLVVGSEGPSGLFLGGFSTAKPALKEVPPGPSDRLPNGRAVSAVLELGTVVCCWRECKMLVRVLLESDRLSFDTVRRCRLFPRACSSSDVLTPSQHLMAASYWKTPTLLAGLRQSVVRPA